MSRNRWYNRSSRRAERNVRSAGRRFAKPRHLPDPSAPGTPEIRDERSPPDTAGGGGSVHRGELHHLPGVGGRMMPGSCSTARTRSARCSARRRTRPASRSISTGSSGVAITHLHADHCSGLEDYGYYSYFGLGRRARIVAHPDVSARLWDGLLAAGMGAVRDPTRGPSVVKRFDDFFDLVPLDYAARSRLARSRSSVGRRSTRSRRRPSASGPAIGPWPSAPTRRSTRR